MGSAIGVNDVDVEVIVGVVKEQWRTGVYVFICMWLFNLIAWRGQSETVNRTHGNE